MSKMCMLIGAAALAMAATVQANPPDTTAEARLTDACRVMTASFQRELKTELMSAMAARGPANTISVCQESAPLIAAHYSDLPGWTIRRTAARLRNPGNAPDHFESAGLTRLAEDSISEFGGWESDSTGAMRFRYMAAIPMAAMCSGCHGDAAQFPDTVKTTIASLYPNDQATGFKPGDLRGAFSITVDWPAGRTVADSLIAANSADSAKGK